MYRLSTVGILLAMLALQAAGATRIKDLTSIQGVRENQLIGYGLVVGLAGTGDRRQTVFSAQSLTNLLQRMGVNVPPSAILVRNAAAVMVTANLPPFSQPGSRIAVNVAAIGDSTNLQGGLLLLTPLKGGNGQTYAVAQGSVVTGGFVAGRGGNAQTVNHPTTGRIADGAIVERAAPSVAPAQTLQLQLGSSDFTTAARIAESINKKFAVNNNLIAQAENSGQVSVQLPPEYQHRQVEFIAALESITVDPDRLAKIVINERTGTIVLGHEVRITPASVLHGGLTVEIQTSYAVSQPEPFSRNGQTVVVPQVGVGVKEDKAKNVVLKDGATVDELVRSLLAIGSTPRDVIAILQSLKAAGALDAVIEVI